MFYRNVAAQILSDFFLLQIIVQKFVCKPSVENVGPWISCSVMLLHCTKGISCVCRETLNLGLIGVKWWDKLLICNVTYKQLL